MCVKEIPHSVERVIQSYGEASQGDEVLIQPMLTDVIRSGVAFRMTLIRARLTEL